MHNPSPAAAAFIQVHREDAHEIREELAHGVMAPCAHIAPKFLYDALGSKLFDAITELPEYYPTRTEALVFAKHGRAMAEQAGISRVLIDLGAGSCAKASRLFSVLNPLAYVAVDISVDYLRESLDSLQQRHPTVPMLGLGMDFSQTLHLPAAVQAWLQDAALTAAPRTVFYPGSSIGNFAPDEALALLRQVYGVCAHGGAGGGLLIGVDLVKPREVLEPAYDDPLGVTAAFNRNLLLNVNRWLGSNFVPAAWRHVAFFDRVHSRIEMHLESTCAQTVTWEGGERQFEQGERMHTENAYKWEPEAFESLLRDAGFGAPVLWTDPQTWFGVFWAPAHMK